eukprot:gene2514-45763_t
MSLNAALGLHGVPALSQERAHGSGTGTPGRSGARDRVLLERRAQHNITSPSAHPPDRGADPPALAIGPAAWSPPRERATADMEKAATEKAGTEKAATEKAGTEKAGTEKAGTEKADTEKAGTEKADTEKADTEKADTEKADTEKGATEKGATEKGATEK